MSRKHYSIGEMSELTSSLNLKFFDALSLQEKKRFMQCFNCMNLSKCNVTEEVEDENGMCKSYKGLLIK